MTKERNRKAATALVLVVAVAGATLGQTPMAHADVVINYPIAFTGGLGAYPRSEPAYNARTGSALPEGTMIPVTCWTYGDTVPPNSLNYTSNLWMLAADGKY